MFYVDHVFKNLYLICNNIVYVLWVVFFFFFGCEHVEILASPPGIDPYPLHWKVQT